MKKLLLLSVILALGACAGSASHPSSFDIVILNGRIMDPESKLDARRNIGIVGGTIRAVTDRPLRGTTRIDAEGLVVAPGFIDMHSHGQDPENYALKAMDGVTAALELEIGAADIDAWYRDREGKAAVNFGVSSGHIPARRKVMDEGPGLLPKADSPAARRAASESEISAIKALVKKGLDRGALGVGFGVQYTPGASRWEILEMFRVAGRYAAPCHIHIRTMGERKGAEAVIGLEEAISAAMLSGAPLHVVHIHSSGLRMTPKLLRMVEEAHARGMDITAECYPYTAAMTDLSSALFNPGWQEMLGIGYGDLQWAATGERLTAETFERYRKEGGMVVIHMIPEEIVRAAVAHPLAIVASDGSLREGKGHPRGSGSFARLLGKFVREQKTLSLMEALRKITILPARRLEGIAPMMKKKGRIRVGADADLVVFDVATVSDRATYEKPNVPSTGMKYVLVGGVPVVKDGKLQPGTFPGKAVRGTVRSR